MEQRSYNTITGGRSVDLLTKDEDVGFWAKRTRLEQALIVICSVLAIMAVCLIIAVVVISQKRNIDDVTTEAPPTTVTTSKPIVEKVCETEICKLAADELKATINYSINPCEDFYSYVCSGWRRDNPIPESMVTYTKFGLLDEKIKNDLIEVLPNIDKYEDRDVRTKAKTFYTSCINTETREAKGVEGLKSVLKSVGGWPLLGEDITEEYNWTDALVFSIRELGTSPIIAFAVGPDAKNTSDNIVQIDQTSLSIGRNELINSNRSDERVKEIMAAYKNLVKQSAMLLGSRKTEDQLDNDINDMVEFERTLATYTRSEEDRRDPNSLYKKITIYGLQSGLNTEQIDILSFFNKIMANITELTNDTNIIVAEYDYLYQTCKLLGQNTTKPETIANYIGWRIVQNYGTETTENFTNTFLEFDKVMMGVEKSKPMNETCIDAANNFLDFALGNLFINHGFDVDTKTEIENMIAELKTAFGELLKSNKWMDNNIKEKALNKLNEMIPMVAYPPWLNNTDKLNEYYEKLGDIIEGSHLENVLTIAKFHIQKQLNKINKSYNRTEEWASAPAVVNAFYDPSANTITFPAGILQPPFYQVGLPPALNFGGIGSVIGHEITHGFDDQGSQFDAQGNLKDWWPPEVRNRFKNQTKCFVEQYGSYKDPITEMMLNGENTLGENIADNGGARESFKAYKSLTAVSEYNTRLPGLDLTADQLFFVGFSYVWCANERKEYLEKAIQYDPHSPPSFRVRGVFSNLEEFSEAFGCPPNSTLNPKHKCLLW